MAPTFTRDVDTPEPTSQRLTYRKLHAADVDAFHTLVIDPHVRRYLLDGKTMPREWSDGEVRTSDRLFEARGVGIWLIFEPHDTENPVGFCGFRVFAEVGPEPQLLYALPHRHTGKGYATEIARTLVEYARGNAGFGTVTSAVDEPNGASIRVLEKVGFRRCGEVPGAFGKIVLFELREQR